MEPDGRRINNELAQAVQCGIGLQYIAGTCEARRYLESCNVPKIIAERVLSGNPNIRRAVDAL